jgi:L-amino acid N-acyltransferase YncA
MRSIVGFGICSPACSDQNDRVSVTSEMLVRTMVADDWPAVADIYAAGIATGHATFETAVPSWPEWDQGHHARLRLVVTVDGRVAGWAAASPVSDRCCYAGVVEDSVYVHPDYQGRGVGRTALQALIYAATELGVWTMQTGIFPENTASVALHQACGFRLVGRRERLGQLGGVWRDVLMLERRAPD